MHHSSDSVVKTKGYRLKSFLMHKSRKNTSTNASVKSVDLSITGSPLPATTFTFSFPGIAEFSVLFQVLK